MEKYKCQIKTNIQNKHLKCVLLIQNSLNFAFNVPSIVEFGNDENYFPIM